MLIARHADVLCRNIRQMHLVEQYIAAGFALVPIPPGKDGKPLKGPMVEGWQLRSNCVTTADRARQLNSGNIGLAHLYCRPSPTCAIDVDDFHKASAWMMER